MTIIPDAPYAAVLGSPISHSLSPVLHRAAYEVLGIDWSYEKFEVEEPELTAFLSEVGPNCRGLSLTMPLKFAAFDVAQVRDSAAASTHVCNTLIRRDNQWHGFNTDVPGFVTSLTRAGVEAVDSATILGAGATACSAVAALVQLGAQSLDVVARRIDQVSALESLFPQVNFRAHSFSGGVTPNQILISTLPAGAADELEVPPNVDVLFDVIYAPWPTRIVERAQGRVILGGLDLLVCQAIEQVFLMTGAAAEMRPTVLEAMYAAGLAEQGRRNT